VELPFPCLAIWRWWTGAARQAPCARRLV